MAISSGTGEADAENLKRIVDELPDVKYLCIDVANGYSEHFVAFVSDIRKQFPNQTIMVSMRSHDAVMRSHDALLVTLLLNVFLQTDH